MVGSRCYSEEGGTANGHGETSKTFEGKTYTFCRCVPLEKEMWNCGLLGHSRITSRNPPFFFL